MATANFAQALQWLFGLMLAAVLAACGGGGGGSPSLDPGPGTNTGTVGTGSDTGTVGPGSDTGVQPGGGGATSPDLGMEFRVNTTTELSRRARTQPGPTRERSWWFGQPSRGRR
jgi:hypothetical protein